MSKIKAKNTLYNDPRYDVVVDSRMLEQHLKEKDQQIAELKKQLEEKDKLIERLQGVIDKLRDKKFAGKTLVEAVNAVYEPLFKNKCDEVEEFKQQLKSQPAEIVEKIKEFVDGNAYYYEEEQYAKHIIKYLDDILKEYQK